MHFIGSSRLGVYNINRDLVNPTTGEITTFERGRKFFELSNHLGNVLVTVSDRKLAVSAAGSTIDYYTADVVNANDYYPGGMDMPGRQYSSTNGYRYGFNGKENDKNAGEGIQDYGMRIYDRRLVRFLSVDPLTKLYPWYTPYQFAGNKPIWAIDLDGLEEYLVTYQYNKKTALTKINITRVQNITTQKLENMHIKFDDGTKNDDSQKALVLANETTIGGDTRSQQNKNSVLPSWDFIMRHDKKEIKNAVPFNIAVYDEKEKRDVGVSSKFNTDNHKQIESDGYLANVEFNAGASDNYKAAINRALKTVRQFGAAGKNHEALVIIATVNKMDKDIRDVYTNMFNKEYGEKVKIQWTTVEKKPSNIQKRIMHL